MTTPNGYVPMHVQLNEALALLDRVRAALQTDETGDNLVEVARAACRAEHELAALERHRAEADDAMRNAAGL